MAYVSVRLQEPYLEVIGELVREKRFRSRSAAAREAIKELFEYDTGIKYRPICETKKPLWQRI